MAVPQITSISPTYGYFKGGTLLTVAGSGFQTGVTSITVLFNNVASSGVTVISDTSMSVVVPQLSAPAEYLVTVVTNGGTSNAVSFYALETSSVPDANISVNNPFFDPAADYTVFGVWNFAQTPVFPGGGGGGGFDPSNSYTFTGTETFNGGFFVNSPSPVGINGASLTLNGGSLEIGNTLANLDLYAAALQIKFASPGINKIEGIPSSSLVIDLMSDLVLNPTGNLQLGSATSNISIGSASAAIIVGVDSAGIGLKLNGVTSIAPGGTLKALLIETTGPDTGKVYIST